MPYFGRMVRRTLPWVVALVVAIGVGRHALLAWQERRGLAALPAAGWARPTCSSSSWTRFAHSI